VADDRLPSAFIIASALRYWGIEEDYVPNASQSVKPHWANNATVEEESRSDDTGS